MGEARHMGTVPAEVLPSTQQRPQLGLWAGREGSRLGAQTLFNEPLSQPLILGGRLRGAEERRGLVCPQ